MIIVTLLVEKYREEILSELKVMTVEQIAEHIEWSEGCSFDLAKEVVYRVRLGL